MNIGKNISNKLAENYQGTNSAWLALKNARSLPGTLAKENAPVLYGKFGCVGAAAGRWAGTALMETLALAPRTVIGLQVPNGRDRANSWSIWSLTNVFGHGASVVVGKFCGLGFGLATSILCLRSSKTFTEWVDYGIQLGAGIGATVGNLVFGSSEQVRGALVELTSVVIARTAEVAARFGGAVGTGAGLVANYQNEKAHLGQSESFMIEVYRYAERRNIANCEYTKRRNRIAQSPRAGSPELGHDSLDEWHRAVSFKDMEHTNGLAHQHIADMDFNRSDGELTFAARP